MTAPPTDLVELGRVVAAYGVKGWIKVHSYSAHAEGLLHTVSATNSAAGVQTTEPPPAKSSVAAPVWWLKRSVAASEAVETAVQMVSYTVQAARPHGAHIVAHLMGFDNRDQADQLRGMGVYVSRQAFPPAAQDEYYWVDLIGCQVFGTHQGAGVLLGVVDQVLDNGVHALLKVIPVTSVDAESELDLAQHDKIQPDKTPPPAKQDCARRSDKARAKKMQPVEILIPFVEAHITHVDLANRRIETNWPLEF